MRISVSRGALRERFRRELTQVISQTLLEAAQSAVAFLKSPAVWGSRPRGFFVGVTQGRGARPGFQSGQIYRNVGVVGPYVTERGVSVGIGDLKVLDRLKPPAFFIPGKTRTIRRSQGGSRGYWWYLEFGVRPNPDYSFVPLGLSPYSRVGRGPTRGMARISDWGINRRGKPRMEVPIARSPTFNRFGGGRRPRGAGKRFRGNTGVGFMLQRQGGKGHPGVRPTYMFLRAQRYLERQVRAMLPRRLAQLAQKWEATLGLRKA